MSQAPRPEGVPARLACLGRCRLDPARQAHHDHLLTVETDPDAMLELLELAVTWAELDHPSETTIPPGRWMEFAERHRWQDVDRVLRIFSLATDIALRALHAASPAPTDEPAPRLSAGAR